MNPAYEPLFTPFSIRNTRIKNRYFMAAMGTVTHNDEDGAYLPDAVDYFVRRAAGGVGLIITGANWVDNNIEVHSPGSFPCPTICPGKYIKAARELTDRVHAFDTKIFVQLTAGLGRSAMPAMIHDRKFVAPSTISNRWNPRIECRELTTEEVERLVEQFGVSAAIAKKCGYDGVEVHAVHEGYLLDCFAMSLFNKRTDKYGGDLNGRLRFAIEIVQKIKQYCGEDFPVILRFSLKSYIKDLRQGAVPGETFTELGRDTDEGLQAARILVDAGYDALDVDAGTYDSWYWAHPPMYFDKGVYLPFAEQVKQVVDVPVLALPGADGDNVVSALDVLEGKAKAGKSVVIIGAGLVACELALHLVQNGHTVTLLARRKLLRSAKLPAMNELMLRDLLVFHGVHIVEGAALESVDAKGVYYEVEGVPALAEGDTVITAVGMEANHALFDAIRDDYETVLALGDGRRVRNIFGAIWDGYEAARSL